MATLTLVYDHHVRELTEKLTELQHQLGDGVRSTLHIHLDENAVSRSSSCAARATS